MLVVGLAAWFQLFSSLVLELLGVEAVYQLLEVLPPLKFFNLRPSSVDCLQAYLMVGIGLTPILLTVDDRSTPES